MLSAHTRGILLPSRNKFPSAEGCRRSRRGGHCTPPPSHEVRHPPPWNHPRKLCLRGARCGGGHSGATMLLVAYLQDFLSPENNVPIEFNKNKKYKNPTWCGIILFRPGICPCWLRCPVMGRPVIHMRRTFVNLGYWGRPSRRPPRKSRPN